MEDRAGVFEQVVLVLVGLIASGKSTFAQALEQHFPQFRRCNQDDLGNRRQVENLARRSLREGLSVCIDRTNIDAAQRSHWIRIAREIPGIPVWVIVFDTPYEICAARLRERQFHPTIDSPEHGLSILRRFASDFLYPSPHEGYDRILSLTPSDHPSPIFTHADIAFFLQRLRHSWPQSFSGTSASISPRNERPYRGARPPDEYNRVPNASVVGTARDYRYSYGTSRQQNSVLLGPSNQLHGHLSDQADGNLGRTFHTNSSEERSSPVGNSQPDRG